MPGRTLLDYLTHPGTSREQLEAALDLLGLATDEQGARADSAVQPSSLPGLMANALNNDGSGNLANAMAVLLSNSTGLGRQNLKVALQAILADEPSPVVTGRPVGLLLTITRVN